MNPRYNGATPGDVARALRKIPPQKHPPTILNAFLKISGLELYWPIRRGDSQTEQERSLQSTNAFRATKHSHLKKSKIFQLENIFRTRLTATCGFPTLYSHTVCGPSVRGASSTSRTSSGTRFGRMAGLTGVASVSTSATLRKSCCSGFMGRMPGPSPVAVAK